MAESSGTANDKTGGEQGRPMITPVPSTHVMCKQHPEEVVGLFCKTCLLYICPECMETEHAFHKSEILSAKAHIRKVLDDMPEYLLALQNRSQSKSTTAAQLQLYLSEQERALTTGLQARQDWEDEVIAKLDKEKRTLVQDIERIFEDKKATVKEANAKNVQGFSNEMEQQISDLKETAEATEASTRDIEQAIKQCQELSQSPLLRDVKELFPVVLREIQASEFPTPDPPPPPPDLPDAHPFSGLGVKFVNNQTKDAHTNAMIKDVNYLRSRLKKLDLTTDPSGCKAVVRPSYIEELKDFRDGKTAAIPRPLQTPNAREICNDTSLRTLSIKACKELAQLLGGHVVGIRQRIFRDSVVDVLVGQNEDIAHVRATVYEDGIFKSCRGSWWLPCHMSLQEALLKALGSGWSRVQQRGTEDGKRRRKPDIGGTTCLDWRSSAYRGTLDAWK